MKHIACFIEKKINFNYIMNVDINSVTGLPLYENIFTNLNINPIFILIILVVIISYFIIFNYFGSDNLGMDNNSNNELSILWIIGISIFFILILVNGLNYFLNTDIITNIKDIFTSTPEIDLHLSNLTGNSSINNNEEQQGEEIVPEIEFYEEVYHIPGNNYSYDNAKALCKAYNGKLANYKQIEEAYKEGAEWCSYGWSDNQMAYYPTQYKSWEKLQKIKGHEHDCGRPGINGGYIDNPNVRFGVNCYGHKPKRTALEAELMKDNQEFPITQKDINLENKIEYWRSRLSDILVAPFNRDRWSRI